MKNYKQFLFIIFFFLTLIQLQAQEVITLKGTLFDRETQQTLPYVRIQVEGENLGTVSNTEGQFEFHIPVEYKSRFLVFYSIGYKAKIIPVKEINNFENLQIFLDEDKLDLDEVVIKPENPVEVLKKAIAKIPENYANSPINMEGFYRELIKENENYVKLVEAACAFHYTPYNTELEVKKAYQSYNDFSDHTASTFISARWYDDLTHLDDQAKILEARSSENLFKGTIDASIAGGPAGILAFDKVKYKTYFMALGQNKENNSAYRNRLKQYVYEITDITTYNNKQVYILNFKPKKDKSGQVAIFQGKIYIDVETLAFVAFEYQTAPSYTQLSYTLAEYDVRHKYHKVRVDYKPIGKKWYLSQISIDDIIEIIDYKTEKVLDTYETSSELLISKVITDNVKKIGENEIFKNTISSHLYEKPLSYDPAFWEKYYRTTNFITLEQKVKKDLERNKPLEQQFIARQSKNEDLVAPVAKVQREKVGMHNDVRYDDFLWLENKNNPEVLEYIKEENTYTSNYSIPLRPTERQLYDEMIRRQTSKYRTLPIYKNGYYYYGRYEGNSLYELLCRKKDLSDTNEEVLININELAKGHEHYEIDGIFVSPDNKTLAYMADTTGNFHTTVQFLNLSDKKLLNDRLERVTSLVWTQDNKAVVYVKQGTNNRGKSVYYHKMGSPQSSDRLIYDEKDRHSKVKVYENKDKKYIFIHSESLTSSEVRYSKATDPSNFSVIFPRQAGHIYKVQANEDKFFVLSNYKADNFKVVSTSITNPDFKKANTVIKTDKNAFIQDFQVFNKALVLQYINNAKTVLKLSDLSGSNLSEVSFEDTYFSLNISNNFEENNGNVYVNYTSFTQPLQLQSINLQSKKTKVLAIQNELKDFNKTQYETSQILVSGQGGTKIPVTLFYKKGTNLQAENPLMLTSFGMLGESMMPEFSAILLSWVDKGYVYAIAHVRGGGEMGEVWHQEGRLLNKKNTFSDYLACVNFLINEKYTNSEKLFAYAQNEGGLSLGVAVNQAPKLFKGVILDDPFLDVISTLSKENMPFTSAEEEEWGDINNKEHYQYIKSYSPYENIQPKVYPNMLFLDYLNDEEIPYWEASKMVAKLRKEKNGENEILMRTNLSDGHSGSTGRFQEERKFAYIYAFVLNLLGENK